MLIPYNRDKTLQLYYVKYDVTPSEILPINYYIVDQPSPTSLFCFTHIAMIKTRLYQDPKSGNSRDYVLQSVSS